MKSRFLAVGLVLLWAASLAFAQTAASSGESLADLARQERARQLKVKKAHSVRVWNNDNMPRHAPGSNPTAATRMSPVPVAPEAPPASLASSPASQGEQHDEAYYRAQMKKLQERLDLHQRQLAVLKQKQAQGQLQYYSDPNKTLQQEYSRSDINKRQDEVSKKQEEIAADQKAIDDLRDQLRREGRPAGWLR